MNLLDSSTKMIKKCIYIVTQPLFFLKRNFFDQKRKEYFQKVKEGKPIEYKLPLGPKIFLYPEGEIAELLYTSKFEYDLLGLVIEYLKKGMNVVDIGANIGLYSIIADKIMGPSGRIWAFEPASDSVSRLKANLVLNQISSVKVVQLALADTDNQVGDLAWEKNHGDGYRYLVNPKEDKKIESGVFGEIEKVKVTTLDSFMRKEGEPCVDFIKIDIEGGEFDALKGAEKVLLKNKNIVVLFENSSIGLARAGHSQKELHNYLRKLGFKLSGWNNKTMSWESSEKALLANGNIWACRESSKLPKVKHKI